MIEDNKIQISEESLRELFSGSVPQEVSNFVAGLQKVSPADLTDILSANPELFSVLTNVPEKAQIAAVHWIDPLISVHLLGLQYKNLCLSPPSDIRLASYT